MRILADLSRAFELPRRSPELNGHGQAFAGKEEQETTKI